MKHGETWKSKTGIAGGTVYGFLIIDVYLGNDIWCVWTYLGDESPECALPEFLTGSFIYENYTKVEK